MNKKIILFFILCLIFVNGCDLKPMSTSDSDKISRCEKFCLDKGMSFDVAHCNFENCYCDCEIHFNNMEAEE